MTEKWFNVLVQQGGSDDDSPHLAFRILAKDEKEAKEKVRVSLRVIVFE